MRVSKYLFRTLAVVLAAGLLFLVPTVPVMADEDTHDARSGLLDAPEKAWWTSQTVAKWKSVKGANRYQVKLYQYGGPEEAVLTVKISVSSYDFGDVMEDGGQYYFMVRAIPKVSEQQIKTAGEWTVSEEGDPVVRGITSGKWRNYPEGSRYESGDGSYAGSGWLMIQGQWYYFSDSCYVVTDTWLDWEGGRYYLTGTGKMQTGWLEWSGHWYCFDPEGRMQTGWVNGEIPNQWYYLYDDGTMAHDTVIDGYTLDSAGAAYPAQ